MALVASWSAAAADGNTTTTAARSSAPRCSRRAFALSESAFSISQAEKVWIFVQVTSSTPEPHFFEGPSQKTSFSPLISCGVIRPMSRRSHLL